MTQHQDYLYQQTRVRDYRDQVRGGLFQLYILITMYFPDCDVSSIIKMQNMIDNEVKNILDKIETYED